LNRIVQSVKPGEFRFYRGRERVRFQKALIGAAGFVVFFDLFGTGLYFAFKLHGGHEEVEEWYQRAINPGKAGLEGGPFHAVIADILADNGAVFLFDEAVVIFLVVS
jgi:hypothetical protein